MTKTEVSIVVAIMGILSAAGGIWPVESIFLILFGWIYFLSDVSPYIRFNKEMFAIGILTVFVLAVGVHWFLAGFYKEQWRLRWSLTGLALFILMFVTSIAFTGLVHQISWLKNGPALVESTFSHLLTKSDLNGISVALALHHKEHGRFPKSIDTGLDRWGTPIKYTSDGQSYILKSYGANGILGGGVGKFDDIVYINGELIKRW